MLTPLKHVVLAPLDVDLLRRRAPGVVENLVTYERSTLRPAPGGVFDEAIFGEGASLDPPRWDEVEVVVRSRATRFGRIVLCEDAAHPFLATPVSELPVLPPDLRPIANHNGEFLMSDVNVHYRQVLVHNGRLRKLRELHAPEELLAKTRADLAEATARLADNERQAEPLRDEDGRIITSLRGLLRPDVATAMTELDAAAGRGVDLDAPLPFRLHRTVATLFALGFALSRGDSSCGPVPARCP
jgi:DNA-directed RNA polymerase beta' subunit